MIFVDGIPFSTRSSKGSEDLNALLEHPFLVSASNTLKAIPEMKVSVMEGLRAVSSTPAKHVYVFQSEYATVDPALVELVGTDEATTCVGLVIRNQKTGWTSIAHVDSPEVVDLGLNQMLSFLIDQTSDAELDVHIVGAFEDAPSNERSGRSGSERESELYDHSIPLCSRIIEALQNKEDRFHIQTFCVLGHNTMRDSDGNACPVLNGFMVETSSGSVRPASFDRSSRCPDETVRRVRVSISSSDPSWKGKLLETYDSTVISFRLLIVLVKNPRWKEYALSLQQLSDSDILLNCSTSPSAEGPYFLDNQRRLFDYLIEHPNWSETFHMRKPRIFKRTATGDWVKVE
ncbi:hypothetical protein MKX01_037849 [Papaver californicum]|nr:hypothetical protein MKX01_037849 [Papaver californicum]